MRRPKYACRTCEEGVVQAPAPAWLIEEGLPTEATVAHVIVGKSSLASFRRNGLSMELSPALKSL